MCVCVRVRERERGEREERRERESDLVNPHTLYQTSKSGHVPSFYSQRYLPDSPLMTSGAMYLMVPTALVRVCSSFFAVPKSHSFSKRPSLKSRTLEERERERERKCISESVNDKSRLRAKKSSKIL